MTTVYGVTFYGANAQIADKMQDAGLVPEDKIAVCSRYVATLVFKSLGRIFDRAKSIQTWLMEASQEVVAAVPFHFAQKYGYSSDLDTTWSPPPLKLRTWNPIRFSARSSSTTSDVVNPDSYPQTLMMWTSPLGFPIAQPYRAHQVVQLKTSIQSVTIHVKDENLSPVRVSKQVAGFPPNFIHSLDACHMLLTAMACYESGLTFASVHDSFWTHASDVDTMSRLLREQFVALHERPILEDLRAEMIQRYEGFKIPVLVPKSELGLASRAHNKLADEVQPTPLSESGFVATEASDPYNEDTMNRDEDLSSIENDNDTQKALTTTGCVRRWKNIKIPELPSRGQFDIRQVLSSTYFFS
jgi:DNA-directed RNA polymerase, mitochondrial